MRKDLWVNPIMEKEFDEKRPYSYAIIFGGQIVHLKGKFVSFEEALLAAKNEVRKFENYEIERLVVSTSHAMLENLLREYKFSPRLDSPDGPDDRNIIEDGPDDRNIIEDGPDDRNIIEDESDDRNIII